MQLPRMVCETLDRCGFVKCDTYKKYMSAWDAMTKAEEDGLIKMEDKYWNALDDIGTLYEKQRSGKLLFRVDRPQATDIRNFLRIRRRKVKVPFVQVYPVIFNLELYFMCYGDSNPTSIVALA